MPRLSEHPDRPRRPQLPRAQVWTLSLLAATGGLASLSLLLLSLDTWGEFLMSAVVFAAVVGILAARAATPHDGPSGAALQPTSQPPDTEPTTTVSPSAPVAPVPPPSAVVTIAAPDPFSKKIDWAALRHNAPADTAAALHAFMVVFQPYRSIIAPDMRGWSFADPVEAVAQLSRLSQEDWSRPVAALNDDEDERPRRLQDTCAEHAQKTWAAIERLASRLDKNPTARPLVRALFSAFVADQRIGDRTPLQIDLVLEDLDAWLQQPRSVDTPPPSLPPVADHAVAWLLARVQHDHTDRLFHPESQSAADPVSLPSARAVSVQGAPPAPIDPPPPDADGVVHSHWSDVARALTADPNAS